MTNVAGHLREQNGTYQMVLSWKDANGKRRTKSISTGLPVKGNKKRAESLLRKTQKEFNPETMQQVSDLPVSEYLNRWLRESVMNLPPETYGRYAYDLGRVVVPYFEKKRLSLKALSPRDLETFFRYERQQEEASVQQLLDWHKELTDALQYAVSNKPSVGIKEPSAAVSFSAAYKPKETDLTSPLFPMPKILLCSITLLNDITAFCLSFRTETEVEVNLISCPA